MKTKRALQLVKGAALLLLLSTLNLRPSTAFGQLPTFMSYQGRLFDGGNPANGNYDFTFAFYQGTNGGTALFGPVTNLNVAVSNGLFTTYINVTGINPSYFSGALARALEVAARTNGGGAFVALTPRQPVTTAPAAFYASAAGTSATAATATTANGVAPNSVTAPDIAPGQVVKSLNGLEDVVTLAAGANITLVTNFNTLTITATGGGGGGSSNAWLVVGNTGTSPTNGNFLGTIDNQPLELRVHGQRALRLDPDSTASVSPNIIAGSPANFVWSGALGATVSGGGSATAFNSVSPNANYGTVGGGIGNTVGGGPASTVGGGTNNYANGSYNTVGGGFGGLASASASTVAGGYQNTASGFGAFVGGGGFDGSSVGGNKASGNASVVSGGCSNLASANYAVVSGGFANLATVSYSAVGGGQSNSASGQWSFVGGGQSNNAAGFFSTVGGGQTNSASGQNSVVGGGLNNNAGLSSSVIGGGHQNSVFNLGTGGTIGGGGLNLVGGDYGTVPGGFHNSAGGTESFAAGAYADAFYDNSFVWSDSSRGPFTLYESAAANTFNVLANGGMYFDLKTGNAVTIANNGRMGIGTTAPSVNLDVRGSGSTETTIWSSNERAILSLHSTISGDQVWTVESGLYGTAGLFGIYDRTAGRDRMTIDTSGNTSFSGPIVSVCTLTIRGGCDLAEPFQISATPEKEILQGSVVVIDERSPGRLKLSDQPYDSRVAGVVSGANGLNPGIQMHQQGLLEGGRNVALTGRVYVLADAANGAIHPGDLLTTSSTPGHAMRVGEHVRAQGAILGKAMSGLDGGKGMVLVLVSLQ